MTVTLSSHSGVIFDFNGVLVFDAHLHERAWNEIAHDVRGQAFSQHEHEEVVHGRTNDEIIRYLHGGEVTEAQIITFANRKEELYRKACRADPAFGLSEGASALLDRLAAEERPFAIATSSGPDNMAFFVEVLKLERWFSWDRIVYDDGSFPGKPDPAIYRKAAAVLGLEPSNCMVIEDSHSGVQAALAAAIGTVVLLSRERSPGLEIREKVTSVISSLYQISL